jgi:hypothetical protein
VSAGTSSRARWLWVAVSAGCAAALLIAGLRAGRHEPVTHTAAYRRTPASAPPAGGAFAGRSQVFGLVIPDADPGQVRFAPARRMQPGGPETVYPANVEPYRALPLAPGAEIRVTAPIALGDLPNYVQGVGVTADRFTREYHESDQRYGPFLDRGHMFELSFDDRGRIVRAHQIFSP